MLFPDHAGNSALSLAERIRAAIQCHEFGAGDRKLPSVTASVGVTLVNRPEDIQSAVARADRALYRAKQNGRNRVEAEIISSARSA